MFNAYMIENIANNIGLKQRKNCTHGIILLLLLLPELCIFVVRCIQLGIQLAV